MRDSDGTSGAWVSSKIKNMMKNMGWQQGKGLGQKGQGIVEPVQAILRPGRGAVGAYGNETKGLKFGENAGDAQRRTGPTDEDFEDSAVDDARNNAWKKSNAGKVRPRYKTLDEVVREETDLDQPQILQNSNVKFIDMTGPTQKVYDNFHSFQQKAQIDQGTKRANFNIPALTENLDNLILSCKNEIHLNNDHLQDLKQKTSGMKRDKLEIDQYVEDAAKSLDRVQNVLELVKRFENPNRDGLDALIEYHDLFQQIKTEYPVEYRSFNLDCLIEFKVLPLIKKLFSEWNPLDPLQTDHGLDQMQKWRRLLSDNSEGVLINHFDPGKIDGYDLIVSHAWFPMLQRAATRWNPRSEHAQMFELVATWIPILPYWIRDVIFDKVIVPKIKVQVEHWDPINDDIPIDKWVIPWHEVLGDRLLDVYPEIRQKLTKALRQWQPTDLTAIAVLMPWKNVFSYSTMKTFLNMNIVPKLEEGLQRMNLNPTQNMTYEEFYAVLEWHELLSQETTCNILVRGLFPQWYDNLLHWLSQPNSVDDVSRYYKEWKDRIPAYLIRMKPIQAEFVRALMAINQARKGLPVQPMPSFEQSQVSMPREGHIESNVLPSTSIDAHPAFVLPTSFKQAVEHRARELGIVFALQPNRNYNGHTVYWLGDRSVYIDGTALFVYDNIQRSWVPTGLEHLISTL